MKSISVVVLALAACADNPSTTVDTTNLAEFCRAAATTGCTTMYACLTDAERTSRHLPKTEPECERKLKASCETSFEACPDQTHEYASDAAATCLDQMSAATCSDAGQAWLDAPACSDVCRRTAGAFRVAWQFEPAYACATLGIATVSVVTTGGGHTHADQFRCADTSGVTAPLPLDKYTVYIELYDTQNVLRWSSTAKSRDIDADVVDLGTITIPVGP